MFRFNVQLTSRPSNGPYTLEAQSSYRCNFLVLTTEPDYCFVSTTISHTADAVLAQTASSRRTDEPTTPLSA